MSDSLKILAMPPHVSPILIVGLVDRDKEINVVTIDLRKNDDRHEYACDEPLSYNLEATIVAIKKLIGRLEGEVIEIEKALAK